MDCEKVRDLFSSFVEGDLNPSEEKSLKEHLASCPECRREFEAFNQTIHWLHDLEEVEVPEGFLAGISREIEDRKRRDVEVGRRSRFSPAFSPKGLLGAAAVVAMVMVATYLSKPEWFERPIPKEVAEEKKAPTEVREFKDVEPPKQEAEGKGRPAQEKLEARGEEKPSPLPQKERAEPRPPAPDTDRIEVERASEEVGEAAPVEKRRSPVMAGRREPSSIEKPPEEIILRVSDREKALSRLRDLVEKFEGNILQTDETALVATLPLASLSAFQGEVEGFALREKGRKLEIDKEREKIMTRPEAAQKREEEGTRKPMRSFAQEGDRATVRIVLIEE